MSNRIGSASLVRTSTFKNSKPPHYEDNYMGTQAEVNTSASAYQANGWQVQIVPGNPYVLTATIDADIGTNNIPITTGSSFITTNWDFHYNTTEKELLHCGMNGVNLTAASWITNIISQDKKTLEWYIANPPTTQLQLILPTGTSSLSVPATMSWDTNHGFSSNSTSIAAAQVVWELTKNGVKTVPIVQPVLTMHQTVPSGYVMTTFTSNLNRVYAKASVQSEVGVPTTYYNCMPQDSDPSSGTVQTEAGANMPLIYGWLKQPPSIQQNGLSIQVTQDWVYGLYFQTQYGSRI